MSAEQPSLAVEIEDAGPCSKKVSITVPAERVDREIEDTFKNVQKAVQFKGFRPGKAPRKLVEARLGDRVLHDVRERLVQTAVEEAVKDADLQTVGEAEADWESIEVQRGTELTFEVTIDVRPEFEIPELKGVEVEKPTLEVNDEMIDREIERLRMERASAEDAGDDPLEERGLASLAVKLECDGETIVDETGIEWAHPSDVLGGMLVEGMAEGLLGKKKGDTAEFTVPLPENFRDEDKRGQDATITLTLESVQKVTMPELNDAFAAELDYDDVEELRDDLRKQLDRQVETRLERALDEKVVEALLEKVPFDLPPSLVRRETGRMLAKYQTQLRQDGHPDEQIREELARAHAEAETRVKRDLRASFVLDKIATERKVFATENEVHQELARMAASYNQSVEDMEDQMIQNGLMSSLRGSIRERKTIAELRGLVTLKDAEPGADDSAKGGDEGDDA
jgi:trigger factor